MVDKGDIERMMAEVEGAPFPGKGFLDASRPVSIVGRQREAKELVRYLVGGLSNGYAAPFISVYGRSGAGKSTLVRFVCESLKEKGVAYAFVNLRMASSVFGCARLVLQELRGDSTGLGIDDVMGLIARSIEFAKYRLFVLVLDEFDSLFSDRRGRPSDFVYMLLEMQEKLRQKGRPVSIIAVSNNAVSGYDLDDRIRSRMGSAAEVPFSAYSKEDVLALLKEKAGAMGCDPGVLEHCAQMCSDEHGDARRAVELLRAAGELAGLEGAGTILKVHVDRAEEHLQKDRVAAAIAGMSYHAKAACAALARIAFLTEQEWHSTSVLYGQYCLILGKEVRPLSYRRVSELLGELVNVGLAKSARTSRGTAGYGVHYRLTVAPELAGSTCFEELWAGIKQTKERHDEEEKKARERRFEAKMGQSLKDPFYSEWRVLAMRNVEEKQKESWREFVGENIA